MYARGQSLVKPAPKATTARVRVPVVLPPPLPPDEAGAALVAAARAEIGVVEESTNSGRRVNQYLAAVGLPGGYYWCGAFVAFLHRGLNLARPPGAGAARAWFTGPRLFFQRGKPGPDLVSGGRLAPGTVVAFYYTNLGRIGHIALVDTPPANGGGLVITVEGNTGPDGGRNGDGVYRKRRPVRTIYAAADWRTR